MLTGSIDLQTLVARLADRRPGRSEANVQSDLHLLLTVAPLDLGDEDLQEIVLESPAGLGCIPVCWIPPATLPPYAYFS